MRRPLIDVGFRTLFSLIFVVAGMGHFGQHDFMLERLAAAPFGHGLAASSLGSISIWGSGVVLVVGGLCLALGVYGRTSAILLAVVLLPITVTVHLANPGHVGPLFKNIALLGGLLHFAGYGTGAWSLKIAVTD